MSLYYLACRRLAATSTLPVAGALAYFSAAGFEEQGGSVQYWRDEVSGDRYSLPYGGVYLAQDADFGGQASVGLDRDHFVYDKLSLASATDGVTIFQVLRSAAGTGDNGQMLWHMYSDNGPSNLDVWTHTDSHSGLYLNTFRSDRVGHDFGQAQLQPRLVVSRVPTDLSQAQLWQNNQLLATNVHAGPSGAYTFPLATSVLSLGWVGQYGEYSFKGKMAVFLVYNRLLTSAEIQQTSSFLMRRYGLI